MSDGITDMIVEYSRHAENILRMLYIEIEDHQVSFITNIILTEPDIVITANDICVYLDIPLKVNHEIIYYYLFRNVPNL